MFLDPNTAAISTRTNIYVFFSFCLLIIDIVVFFGRIWVLGDSFMEDYLVVFDRGARTVSFASLVLPPPNIKKNGFDSIDLDQILLNGQGA